MRARCAVLTLAFLVLTPGMPHAKRSEAKAWIQGPVRYIALPAEIDLFKQLESDAERNAFIEGFWHRRDPTPETLTNEARQLFWERVRTANLRFVEGTKPGWMTDRGKIHILYGAPQRIEDDRYYSNPDNPVAGRGVIRWIYEGRPGGRMDLGPTVVVPFERDVGGEYRLSSDPTLASEFYDLASIKERQYYERWMNVDIVQSSRSPLAVMADLGKMQELPSQEQMIIEKVETFESYGAEVLEIETQRYRDPDGDGVVLKISAALPGAPGERPTLIARFERRDGAGAPRIMGEGSFGYEGAGPTRQAQGRIRLDPGVYDLTVLAVQVGSDETMVYKGPLEIETVETSGALEVSDLALAAELEPLEFATLATYDEPFVVGHFRVVPRFGRRLPRGEPLVLFYEVYGGALPLKVTYRLEGKEDDGSWTSLGEPIVQDGGQGAQGWSLPTNERWPLGKYRVVVVVEDGGGVSAQSRLDFELVDPESS